MSSENNIIRHAETDDLVKIIEFNLKMYPSVKLMDENYFRFWCAKSDSEICNFVLLLDKDSSIVGQCLFSSMRFNLHNKSYASVWGFNLIVDPLQRGKGLGFKLMSYAKKQFPSYFGSGVGPMALPLHKKLGCQEMGHLRKYVGVLWPQYLLNHIFSSSKFFNCFPDTISDGNNCFKLLRETDLSSMQVLEDEKYLIFSRDEEFVKWRFFHCIHDYYLYYSNDCNYYFVVRPIRKFGVWMLILVDYRCDVNELSFNIIFRCVKQLMKQLHFAILIVGSSLSVFDKVFETHHFLNFGTPRVIIGNIASYQSVEENILKRDFIFETFADSDGEIVW